MSRGSVEKKEAKMRRLGREKKVTNSIILTINGESSVVVERAPQQSHLGRKVGQTRRESGKAFDCKS